MATPQTITISGISVPTSWLYQPPAKTARAITNAQDQGPITQLTNQIANQNRTTARAIGQVGGYYNTLGNQVARGYTDEGKIANSLNTGLATATTNAVNAAGQTGDQAMQSYMKYLPGAANDPSLAQGGLGSLASEIARQTGEARGIGQMYQGLGELQGANYKGLAAAELGTAGLAGQEQLGSIARSGQQALQPLVATQAGLIAKKGADYATNLAAVKQQNITNLFGAAGLRDRATATRNAFILGNRTITAENQRNQAAITSAENRTRWMINAEWQRNQASIQAREQMNQASIAARQRLAKARGG